VVRASDASLLHDSLTGVQAVIFGSTGRRSITEEETSELSRLVRFVKRVDDHGVPMLGINYGAHLLTLAFGGSVVRDLEKREIGSTEVRKTDQAANDPILRHLPDRFVVQQGHVDHIEAIPPGATPLLVGGEGEVELWAFEEKGIYASEVQLDLDKEQLIDRLVYYNESYIQEPGELASCILHLQSSPDATRFLPLFLSEVVQKHATVRA